MSGELQFAPIKIVEIEKVEIEKIEIRAQKIATPSSLLSRFHTLGYLS